MRHQVDGDAHQVDGEAHQVDGEAHQVDGNAHQVDGNGNYATAAKVDFPKFFCKCSVNHVNARDFEQSEKSQRVGMHMRVVSFI